MGGEASEASAAPGSRRGHWSGLIWLGLAALAVKVFAIDAVAEDAFVKENWTRYEGTITASEVVFAGVEEGHELHYTFRVELPGGPREYTGSLNQASGKDHGREVEGQFAVGNPLEVYVDPEDPARYRRPQSQTGLRWIGYLAGGFLGLIGLSVLRGGGGSSRVRKSAGGE